MDCFAGGPEHLIQHTLHVPRKHPGARLPTPKNYFNCSVPFAPTVTASAPQRSATQQTTKLAPNLLQKPQYIFLVYGKLSVPFAKAAWRQFVIKFNPGLYISRQLSITNSNWQLIHPKYAPREQVSLLAMGQGTIIPWKPAFNTSLLELKNNLTSVPQGKQLNSPCNLGG